MGENKKGNKFRKGLAVVLASIGLATSAVGCGNNQVTLEEAVEAGVLNEEFKDTFEEMHEKLEEPYLSNEEIATLMREINNFQFEVDKTKISGAIGEKNIKFGSSILGGYYEPTIKVNGEVKYNRDNMDSNIQDAIADIGNLQTEIGNLNLEYFDAKKYIKDCNQYLNNLEYFAVLRVEEENGKLRTENIQKVANIKEDDKENNGER